MSQVPCGFLSARLALHLLRVCNGRIAAVVSCFRLEDAVVLAADLGKTAIGFRASRMIETQVGR